MGAIWAKAFRRAGSSFDPPTSTTRKSDKIGPRAFAKSRIWAGVAYNRPTRRCASAARWRSGRRPSSRCNSAPRCSASTAPYRASEWTSWPKIATRLSGPMPKSPAFTPKLAIQLAWLRLMRRGAPLDPPVRVSNTASGPGAGAGPLPPMRKAEPPKADSAAAAGWSAITPDWGTPRATACPVASNSRAWGCHAKRRPAAAFGATDLSPWPAGLPRGAAPKDSPRFRSPQSPHRRGGKRRNGGETPRACGCSKYAPRSPDRQRR